MSHATEMLAAYQAAEKLVLAGQAADWGDRRLRMADLAEIQAGVTTWERKVQSERRQAAGDYSSARAQLATFPRAY